MVTVPAFVWRGGFFLRALITGGVVGLAVGVLAWLDSGFLIAGAIVFVIVGTFYGMWMSRRMARYWPGARRLTGDQRVMVARTARRGESIGDPDLAQAVIDYRDGLHASAESARPLRWLLIVVLVVAAGTAVWDWVFGSWANAVASVLYLAALLVEVFWWPPRHRQLLANTDYAADVAAQVLSQGTGSIREDH
ncbi:hypothetical protein AU193_02130 [Mycobacterium sp. GA-1285]|uniref:hypothetical protein n=1 Tax=Mycobacterium sp. GA-1285 TaxID=1772282 RepID=UPI000748C524|nr:hypothetical protein [Mycobacterium sp. GA-1285]KUI11931.1 hypothetical protein AU193_02130 [Mycobacterium sp. GA-1285]